MNAILYVNKTGSQWRMQPKDFPPYNTEYYYYRKWKNEGVFEDFTDSLRGGSCGLWLGKENGTILGLIDSRSVTTSHHVAKDRGIDGNKDIKGMNEHVVVDTMCLPMAVKIYEANIYDSVGAVSLFEKFAGKLPGFKRILVDGGYYGQALANAFKNMLGCNLRSVLTIVPKGLHLSRKGRSLKCLSSGWETLGESLLRAVSFIPNSQKPCYKSPSHKSCLEKLSYNFKMVS